MDSTHPDAIVVTLGGKVRRLRLGPAAFRLAERDHGITFSLADFNDAVLSPGRLALLVFVGLLPENRDLKEDTVIDWLLESDDEDAILGAVFAAVMRMAEGYTSAFGDAGNPKRPRRK